MCNPVERIGTLLAATVFVSALALPVDATAQSGRIICWTDKAGNVIGCGDKVPPEFRGNATKELSSRGVTRKTTESAEEATRRLEREREAARLKAEEERKALDQKRLDTALLDTYSNEKEIDLKRDRDLGAIDLQLEQLNGSLKNITQRYNETKSRVDAMEKNKKATSPALKDELTRATNDKERIEKAVEAKKKEREELQQRFAEQRKRFTELRSAQAPSTSAKK